MTRMRPCLATAAVLGLTTLITTQASPSPKKGFVADIEALTESNNDFRRVLYTGKKLQLVLMAIAPGEDIGAEVHEDVDQFFRVEQGKGEVQIDGVASPIESDDAFIVPAGARHNVMNTGNEPLRVYTIYAPPEHRDGIVRATKAEAGAAEAHFDGKTTE
jgi:mannose-6-phosphate isomerase-like protein (cupin superfamily)